jgi:hypothetical protein
MPDLAVEVKRSDLAAGSYFLLWDHQLTQNPLELRQHYVITIRRDDGKVIGEWRTPAEVDLRRRTAGVAFTLTTEDHRRPLTISLLPESGGRMQYGVRDLSVVPAGLEVDADRDGIIVAGERPPAGQPLRHWINDDDDAGDWQTQADLPGLTGTQADHAREGIDGSRDLVDFIPLNLALGAVVRRLRPEDGFKYVLRQADRCVQVVPTGLTRASVGALHRNDALSVFGPALDGPCATAEVLRPDADGAIEHRRNEIARLESSIASRAFVLANDSATPEERTQALLDTKQHAERIGRLKAEISSGTAVTARASSAARSHHASTSAVPMSRPARRAAASVRASTSTPYSPKL